MLLTVGRRPLIWILVAAFVCLFSSAVHAQAVSDPNIAEFTPSTDHNATDASGVPLVTRYSLAFYTVGGVNPVLTADLGKPSPDPDGKIRVNFRALIPSLPAPGVTYEARVASVGPTGVSESLSSNQFSFTATPCSPTISPASQSVAAGGGTGTVNITAAPGCTWTAVSTVTWVTVTSGASGSGNGGVGFSVSANTGASLRTGTISVAGQTFTISQAGTSCSYTVTPASVSMSAAAGSGSVTVSTTSACTWTGTDTANWLTISNGTGRTGSGALNFTVTANTGAARSTTLLVAGNNVNVTQAAGAALPSLTVSPSTLNVAVNIAGLVRRTTTAQQLIVTQSGSTTPAAWTVASSVPWLIVSPTSGSGTASVNVTVSQTGLLPASGSTGTITVSSSAASGGSRTSVVTLTMVNAPAAAFGVMETPVNNTTGVTGSIAVTGWALDDVDVAKVRVLRDPVAGEAGALVYLGDAVLVNGARPDVAQLYPTLPHNTRAGWGLLVLTNMLPNLGNGMFRLHAYADDMDGHSTLLGSRTITCANSTAIAPFGAIDTPGQGETVSGTNYSNFGWVLSRGTRRADPPGGGTVQVVIDGAFVGSPVGWTNRADLTALFPAAQYSGISRALGVYGFNTTTLVNGVHTIAWVVTDNLGTASGIGSRYFSVLNGGTALTLGVDSADMAAETADPDHSVVIAGPAPAAVGLSAADVSRVAAQSSWDATPVAARRGFSPDTPFRRLRMGADGRFTVQAEELDRVELRLTEDAGQTCSGYQVTSGVEAALPVGSSLDASACVFAWQPGVGFVGTYDFVFVRHSAAGAVRQDVRIVLNAKRSGLLGPQVMIDAPGTNQRVGRSFVVAGWAVDLDADTDTGVDTLHVWAYPAGGGAPTFLGVATQGGIRPDVAAIYGSQFRASGYGLEVNDLAPGTYDVAVFAWSTVTRGFVPASVVRVTVR